MKPLFSKGLMSKTLPSSSKLTLGLQGLTFFLTWIILDIERNVVFGLWVSLASSALLVAGAAIDWFQCRPARPAASNTGAGQ